MSEPTSDQLQQLLELSETDTEIRKLRKQLDALPEQKRLAETIDEVRALTEARADRTLDLDAAQSEANREDREVDLLRQRLEAEQQRMYGGGITNPKELQSLRAEIESVKRRIDEHESAELEAMERVEQVEADIAGFDERIAAAQQRISELEASRDASAQTILAELAEREVLRDRQRGRLPDEFGATYDAAAEKHHGQAVGRLDGDRCTACGISLSYADVNELMEGSPLSTCPSCRRLLLIF